MTGTKSFIPLHCKLSLTLYSSASQCQAINNYRSNTMFAWEILRENKQTSILYTEWHALQLHDYCATLKVLHCTVIAVESLEFVEAGNYKYMQQIGNKETYYYFYIIKYIVLILGMQEISRNKNVFICKCKLHKK